MDSLPTEELKLYIKQFSCIKDVDVKDKISIELDKQLCEKVIGEETIDEVVRELLPEKDIINIKDNSIIFYYSTIPLPPVYHTLNQLLDLILLIKKIEQIIKENNLNIRNILVINTVFYNLDSLHKLFGTLLESNLLGHLIRRDILLDNLKRSLEELKNKLKKILSILNSEYTYVIIQELLTGTQLIEKYLLDIFTKEIIYARDIFTRDIYSLDSKQIISNNVIKNNPNYQKIFKQILERNKFVDFILNFCCAKPFLVKYVTQDEDRLARYEYIILSYLVPTLTLTSISKRFENLYYIVYTHVPPRELIIYNFIKHMVQDELNFYIIPSRTLFKFGTDHNIQSSLTEIFEKLIVPDNKSKNLFEMVKRSIQLSLLLLTILEEFSNISSKRSLKDDFINIASIYKSLDIYVNIFSTLGKRHSTPLFGISGVHIIDDYFNLVENILKERKFLNKTKSILSQEKVEVDLDVVNIGNLSYISYTVTYFREPGKEGRNPDLPFSKRRNQHRHKPELSEHDYYVNDIKSINEELRDIIKYYNVENKEFSHYPHESRTRNSIMKTEIDLGIYVYVPILGAYLVSTNRFFTLRDIKNVKKK